MQFQSPEWHDQLTSTNTVLCDRFLQDNSLPDGFILATHHQTSGRGRLGRSWQTLDSKNLTFSFLLKSINNFHQITALPMAVAISVASALEYHGLNVQTKWPNDLLIRKALELNGTITGEHGIGLHKKEYLLEEHPDNIPVMKSIKRTLDPNNIMNPGKIFDIN